MTAPAAYRAPGAALGLPVWEEWVAEVGAPVLDAAGCALRALAAPLRAAGRALAAVRWGTGETAVASVTLGLPAVALVRWYPRVVWPSVEQAATSLQRAVLVLAVAWLALYLRAGVDGGGGRGRCICGGHRAYAPSGGRAGRRWATSLHEAGHLVVGKRLGRRTGKAKLIGNNGAGVTQVWPNHRDIVGEIAIDMAGAIAEGSWAGASGDQQHAAWRLRKFVEPQRRDGVRAAGLAKAHAMVAAYRGEIERVARRIEARGWTR